MPHTSNQQPSPGKVAIPILIRDLPTQASCNPEPIASAAGQQSELAPAPTVSAQQRALRDATWAIEDLDCDHGEFVDDLSEEYLREVAGTDDLASLTYLELTIDTTDQSVEPLGRMLPSIQQLKLNHSRLASFRDLGTQLRSLRILWLNRSGVTELDGVGALTGLKELYLAFNNIADLTPLAMHEELQVLDLDTNCVADANQVDQLGTCPNLISLCLEHNPVCKLRQYRRVVLHHIPRLLVLDDEEVADDDVCAPDAEAMAMAASPVKPRGDANARGAGGGGAEGEGEGAAAGGGDDDDDDDGYEAVGGSLRDVKAADRAGAGGGGGGGGGGPVDLAAMAARLGITLAPGLAEELELDVGASMSAGAVQQQQQQQRAAAAQRRSSTSAMVGRPQTGPDGVEEAGCGSSLTHGCDAVFAGSAVRALRDRRRQRDDDDADGAAGGGRAGAPARRCATSPSKLAGMSITATLDRAAEFDEKLRRGGSGSGRRSGEGGGSSGSEGERSREEVLEELKAWKLEGGGSGTGAVEQPPSRGGSGRRRGSKSRAKRASAGGGSSARPSTAAPSAGRGGRAPPAVSSYANVRASHDSALGKQGQLLQQQQQQHPSQQQFGHGYGAELCTDGVGRPPTASGRAGREDAISMRSIQRKAQLELWQAAGEAGAPMPRPGTAFASKPCVRPGTAAPASSPWRQRPGGGGGGGGGYGGEKADVLVLDGGDDADADADDEGGAGARGAARRPSTNGGWGSALLRPSTSSAAARAEEQSKRAKAKAAAAAEAVVAVAKEAKEEKVVSTADLARSLASDGMAGVSLQAFLAGGGGGKGTGRPWQAGGGGSSDEDSSEDERGAGGRVGIARPGTSGGGKGGGRRESSAAAGGFDIASGLDAIEKWNDALDAKADAENAAKLEAAAKVQAATARDASRAAAAAEAEKVAEKKAAATASASADIWVADEDEEAGAAAPSPMSPSAASPATSASSAASAGSSGGSRGFSPSSSSRDPRTESRASSRHPAAEGAAAGLVSDDDDDEGGDDDDYHDAANVGASKAPLKPHGWNPLPAQQYKDMFAAADHEVAGAGVPAAMPARSAPATATAGASTASQRPLSAGAANAVSDDALVELLRRKPKTTVECKSTAAFRKYFAGMTVRQTAAAAAAAAAVLLLLRAPMRLRAHSFLPPARSPRL